MRRNDNKVIKKVNKGAKKQRKISQKMVRRVDFGFEKEKRKRFIKNLSWGVAKTLSDLVFLQLVFFSSLVLRGRYVQKELHQVFEKYREVDWEKIRKALGDLKRKGLIDYVEGKLLEAKITEAGFRRYKSFLPVYDEKRVWDGKVYLITYDIPEGKRDDRDKLRDFLERTGCGKLQASVWLTCYNPKQLVGEFVKSQNISGSVIVSDIGKDGSVGEEDLKDLIARVFKLEELNERYQDFILKVKNGEIGKYQIGFAFASILQDDPQLPFELLPDGWLGEKAYKIFRET